MGEVITDEQFFSQFENESIGKNQPLTDDQFFSKLEGGELEQRQQEGSTTGEKIQTGIKLVSDIGLGTAASIYGAGVGGTYGAAAGAVVGQFLIPVPGIGAFAGSYIGGAIGAFAGGVAGGAAGTATSVLLTNITDSIINGEELTNKQVAKNMIEDAKTSAVVDVAVQAALKAAPVPLRIAGKLIPEKMITNLFERVKGLKNLDLLNTQGTNLRRTIANTQDDLNAIDIKFRKDKLAVEEDAIVFGKSIKVLEKEGSEITDTFTERIDKMYSKRADTITNMIEPFTKSLDTANNELKQMYNKIKEVFGEVPVDISKDVEDLNKIINTVGLDQFDQVTLNKVARLNKVIEDTVDQRTLNLANSRYTGPTDFNAVAPGAPGLVPSTPFKLTEAVEMKQDLFDISNAIFSKKGGSAAKGGIGQEINSIRGSLDLKISKATGGKADEVNRAYNGYKTIQNVSKTIVKDFNGELGGEIGSRLTGKKLGKTLNGYFDSLSKLDENTIKRIAEGKESVAWHVNSAVDNLIELPNALIYTGNPELVEQGQKMFTHISELQDFAFDTSTLETGMKDMLTANKGYIEKVKGTAPDMKELVTRHEVLKIPLDESNMIVRQEHRKIIERSEDIATKIGLSGNMMKTKYAGLMAANALTAAGQVPAAAGMRVLAYLSSLGKYNPKMTSLKLDMAQKIKGLTNTKDIPYEVKALVSKSMNYMLQLNQEEKPQ